MQEIKKQAIVIASILKPLDDTRMFEKMGRSLELTGLWSVHIIGFGKRVQDTAIQFHSLGIFSRLSIRRLTRPFMVLKWLIRIKPRVVIINTHELLIIATIYKILSGCRSFYDIRENYYLNILHTNAFPPGIRHLMAAWARLKEWIASPLIDHFILAEASYKNELRFIGKRFTAVENKCVVPGSFKRKPVTDKIRLLFTGTIDRTTGIEQAIELSKKLHAIDARVELRVVGYCALPSYREKVLSETNGLPFASTSGLSTLVSHNVIFDEIAVATAGIIFYPPSTHNEDRIPTKVYEYMACELPILYDGTATWAELISGNGIAVDFQNIVSREIITRLSEKLFYTNPVETAQWATESPKFLRAVSQ